MALTKLLRTEFDDDGFVILNESVLNPSDKVSRKLLPNNLKEARKYLTDINSDIYKYRSIPRNIIELSVKLVNNTIYHIGEYTDAIEALEEVGNANDYKERVAAVTCFTKQGYYKSRITSIIYKMAGVLSILCKHRGTYNRGRYISMIENENLDYHTYNYEDVTYIPAQEWKELCGTHSASDYQAIKFCLQQNNVIKELSSRWSFKTEVVDNITGVVRELGEGIAKPTWINPEFTKELSAKSELVCIPSNGIFNNTISRLAGLDDVHFAAIYSILKLKVSKQMHNAALKRLQMPASERYVREGFEDEEEEYKIYGYRQALNVTYNDKNGKNKRDINITSQTANIIEAMYNFDILPLLRFTIDDYSGRLHTPITRLMSEVRNNLRWSDDSQVVDIDIRACQPTLFLGLLAKHGYPELASEVGNKDFYKFLASELKHTDYDALVMSKEERTDYKLLFMESDYSTGSSFKRFVKMLAEVVMRKSGEDKANEFIKFMYELANGKSELNINDGFEIQHRLRVYDNGYSYFYVPSALPKRMQCQEVDIMFGKDGVLERLIKAGITQYTTIHDAILVKEADAELAHDIMQSTFVEKLGCIDSGLKIDAKMEVLNPGPDFECDWDLD